MIINSTTSLEAVTKLVNLGILKAKNKFEGVAIFFPNTPNSL